MKMKIIALLLFATHFSTKTNFAPVYAQAVACSKDTTHCQKLKNMLFSMNFFKRQPILIALGATALRVDTPPKEIQAFVKNYFDRHGLTSGECTPHQLFVNKESTLRCKKLKEQWIQLVCGSPKYYELVKAAYSNIMAHARA